MPLSPPVMPEFAMCLHVSPLVSVIVDIPLELLPPPAVEKVIPAISNSFANTGTDTETEQELNPVPRVAAAESYVVPDTFFTLTSNPAGSGPSGLVADIA